MDLLRSTIETIFYDLSPDLITDIIIDNNRDELEQHLRNVILESVSRKNGAFTKSEHTLLLNILENEWIRFKPEPESQRQLSLIFRLLLLLQRFSNLTLTLNSNDEPVVKFDNLLRWRCLSYMLGEDNLTIPFLAERDVRGDDKRRHYLWPNILDHDNFRLNSILDEELSDTHSHINAASDIFEFNWICLMNYPGLIHINSNDAKHLYDFVNQGIHKDYDKLDNHNRRNYTLSNWIEIAAAIRVLLFSKIGKSGISDISMELIKRGMSDVSNLDDLLSVIQLDISYWKDSTKLTHEGNPFDYAIQEDDFSMHDDARILSSPFMIHYGERKILYRWFYEYYMYSEKSMQLAGLVLLYLIIKIKVRREFVQTNPLVGFLNFQEYNRHKNYFIPKRLADYFYELSFRYAVQTSLGNLKNHNLEARVIPSLISKYRKIDYTKPIFGDTQYLSDKRQNQVTLIAHFLKRPEPDYIEDGSIRHSHLRNNLWREVKSIIKEYKNNEILENDTQLVGIDAASSELVCRPEVFAPMFRYARYKGISSFTFHAGEDFYDIVDGLRTIDETVKFMDFQIGNRIGHALALGVDVDYFYNERHHTVLIPKQTFLDNLVWMKITAESHNIQLSPQTIYLIEKHYWKLTKELGYADTNRQPSIYEYYQSMNLRGDVIGYQNNSAELIGEYVYHSPVSLGKGTNHFDILRNHYEMDAKCRRVGAEAMMVKLPETYRQDVARLQSVMISEIENRGIVIETNPSSNLKIGRFKRYDQHPITKFHGVTDESTRHSIVVSINTDDKGIFATSLRNEFSLIAIALHKMKSQDGNAMWSDLQIENYIKRIARYGNISRFRPHIMTN